MDSTGIMNNSSYQIVVIVWVTWVLLLLLLLLLPALLCRQLLILTTNFVDYYFAR
jgi:hypothetical protein